MDRKPSLAIAMIAVALSACATLEQYKVQGGLMAGKAADATGEFVATYADIVVASGKSATQRMTEYLHKKELLKTFTDAADEGEDALVYLRRRASIGGISEGMLPNRFPDSGSAPALIFFSMRSSR